MRQLWRLLRGESRYVADAEALARGDPWVRLPLEPPLMAYGPGLQVDFANYLAGPSKVTATSPEEIASWLLDCRYADDRELLDDHDHWLHPRTFEVVRAGDCEDFALWAWRELLELRFDAEFVVGSRRRAGGEEGRHAWVVFRRDDLEFVLDGVERKATRIIRLLADARPEYEPQVGVSANGTRFVFAGLYRTAWGRRLPVSPHGSR